MIGTTLNTTTKTTYCKKFLGNFKIKKILSGKNGHYYQG